VVEFAFARVPDRLRVTASERKILPRMLAERVLPRGMDLRRKQGFSVPLQAWFNGAFGAFVREVLAGADPRLFRRSVIDEMIEGQERGRSNVNRLFILTLFELWRREYRISF
jgi:asparagine synthase (glutamine-hydrolysing)